jgi:hypothetical protein
MNQNESVDKEREKVDENYCKKDLKTEDKERSTDAICTLPSFCLRVG